MPDTSARDNYASAELVPVGDRHCLFQPENHAVALLNDFAASTWRNLTDGANTQSINGPINDLVAGWTAAGFLPAHQSAFGAQSAEYPLHHRPTTQTYSLGNARAVGLAVEDEQLATLLSSVLAPLQKTAPAEAQVHVVNSATKPDTFEIWSDGERLAECGNRSDARRITLQALLLALHGPERVAAILHASAIAINGRCIVLAGITGSGKSTLTTALVAKGADYLGDDLVPIASDGAMVGGFPTAASIKSGSWDIVANMFPDLPAAPIFHLGERQVRYLDFADKARLRSDFLPLSAILFPQYRSTEKRNVAPLTADETFAKLISTGTEITGDPRSVKPLAALVNKRPAYRLEYGTLVHAIHEVFSIAER